jgi:hypothetical protein
MGPTFQATVPWVCAVPLASGWVEGSQLARRAGSSQACLHSSGHFSKARLVAHGILDTLSRGSVAAEIAGAPVPQPLLVRQGIYQQTQSRWPSLTENG